VTNFDLSFLISFCCIAHYIRLPCLFVPLSAMIEHPSREIILSHLKSAEPFPVDFDLGFAWLDYSSRGTAKRSLTEAGFKEGTDFSVFCSSAKNPKGGRPSEKIFLSVPCFKQWAMMAPTAKGKEVREMYLRIEEELAQIKGNIVPFPNSEPQALPKASMAEIKELADTVLGGILEPQLLASLVANQIAVEYPHMGKHCEAVKKHLELPIEIENELMTVTDLAALYKEASGKSLPGKGTKRGDAMAFNNLLIEKGYQSRVYNEPTKYRPTKKGEPFAKFVLQSAKGNNKTVHQLKWSRSLIEDLVANEGAEEAIEVKSVEVVDPDLN